MIKKLIETIIQFVLSNKDKLIRWIVSGFIFMGLNTFFLYIFIDVCSLGAMIATFLAAEVGTILRYFVNSYWVFNKAKLSIRSCWQYHLANASTFFVWWSATNVLIMMGISYVLAGILAVALSSLLSLYTNFFWIWSKSITKKINR